MSAQDSQASFNASVYIRACRKVSYEPIFKDNQDYEVFVNFLKEYFTDLKKVEKNKKEFTIRGKTYKGIPYQTQNFFGQIELIAYKLEPNSFDLLLKENVQNAIEKFIRAISTRYVLYFNKKHNRSGSLFRDPYIIQKVGDNDKDLSEILKDLHSNFSKKEEMPDFLYSSYPEYMGQRVTDWINIINLSDSSVEDQRSILTSNIDTQLNNQQSSNSMHSIRLPELILASLILISFSTYGFFNIQNSTVNLKVAESPETSPQPQVSGAKDIILEPSPSATFDLNEEATSSAIPQEEIRAEKVKIISSSERINLREASSSGSRVITTAIGGEIFELINEYPEWYEIILIDGQNAFVSNKLAEKIDMEAR